MLEPCLVKGGLFSGLFCIEIIYFFLVTVAVFVNEAPRKDVVVVLRQVVDIPMLLDARETWASRRYPYAP
jgi:hypothetical protein